MFLEKHPIATIFIIGLICGTIMYVADTALICTRIIHNKEKE